MEKIGISIGILVDYFTPYTSAENKINNNA